jgi:hypothetical protein
MTVGVNRMKFSASSVSLRPLAVLATAGAVVATAVVALPTESDAASPCRIRTSTHLKSSQPFANGGVLRRFNARAKGSATGGYDHQGKVLMTRYPKGAFPALINAPVGGRKAIGDMVKNQRRNAVGAINGDFFTFPDIRGVNDIEMSRGPMVRDGRIIRGTSQRMRAVGVTMKRQPFGGMIAVRGSVLLGGTQKAVPIRSMNWQNVKGGGANVYTSAYSDAVPRPRGRIEWVLNDDNRIRKVRSPARNTGELGDPVRSGTRVIAFAKNMVDEVRGAAAGTKVTVNIRQSTDTGKKLYTAVGRGLPMVLRGVPAPLGCNAYAHSKAARPRTFVGWDKQGRWRSFTVPGKQFDGVGLRTGGFGLASAANIAAKLGMVRAYELDGGGSTTLWTRSNSGNWSRRDLYGVDTRVCACERPMTNGLAFIKR